MLAKNLKLCLAVIVAVITLTVTLLFVDAIYTVLFFFLTAISLILLVAAFIFDKTSQTTKLSTVATLIFATLTLISIILFCLPNKASKNETGKTVVRKIEDFKKVTGRYPNCENADQLVDTVGLNLNLIDPDNLTFILSKEKDSYSLKVKENKATYFYESKSTKWTCIIDK